jgi:hypothetical protein
LSAKLLLLWVIAWRSGFLTVSIWKVLYRTACAITKRHENQWNTIEDLDTNPCGYSHLIFDKGTQNICWKKKIATSTNGAGKTGFPPTED